MNTGLHKQARAYCAETCPDVDRAFSQALTELEEFFSSDDRASVCIVLDELRDKVKLVGTEKLRDALCSAISDMNDIEAERDDLRDQVRDLESKVDDLTNQVEQLERELAEVSA